MLFAAGRVSFLGITGGLWIGWVGGRERKRTRHKELAVGVVVNVELEALAGLGGGDPGLERRGLGGVGGGAALEVVGAGVGGGAAGEAPLEGPVAVHVAADAVAARGGLAVLAPHAVVGLGVDETCFFVCHGLGMLL